MVGKIVGHFHADLTINNGHNELDPIEEQIGQQIQRELYAAEKKQKTPRAAHTKLPT